MAYVLTNGSYYVRMTKTGGVTKTKDINEARIYITTEKAKERLLKAPGKTNGYYIQDVETNAKYKFSRSKGRINFPKEVRELIYNTAKGRCALCGRKITYDRCISFTFQCMRNSIANIKVMFLIIVYGLLNTF